MKHDTFFQFANGSPECAFERFGMFFAEALRRKSMPNETLELRQLKVRHVVHWSVAFRAGQAGFDRLAGSMVG